MTLITARSSGASFLNRVELQNGCLTRGHANLFIPSTLSGCCMDSGQINDTILQENLKQAIDVYVNHVNHSPCGDTVIQLFKGADAKEFIKYREPLKIFLKGSKKKKMLFSQEHPDLYRFFNDVWELCNQHMIKGYPCQYVFHLCCCFKDGCIHPLCKQKVGSTIEEYKWYTDGPPVNKLLLPVADPNKPWGDKECKDCKGFCSGHYLKPVEVFNNKHGQKFSQPPSVVIQNKLKQSSHVNVTDLACSTLLPVEEVNIWIDHLTTVAENRKKGSQKAAKACRAKHFTDNEDLYNVPDKDEGDDEDGHCGICGILYEDETDEIEQWITCNKCSTWYHWKCVDVVVEPDSFVCSYCE